jgi:mono/diheme cytochrome c family protein
MNALAALLAAFTLLAMLAVRALRFKRPFVHWGGASLAGLAAIACLAPAVLMAAGLSKARFRRAPTPNITIPATAEQVQRGQAIASGFCGACHSSTDTMTGGRDLGEHLPVPIGHFIAANLTPVGPLSRWSDGQIFRAIRNSIDADGRWLTVMSLTNVGRLSDQDVEALIAYIRSLPASGKPTPDPPDALNPLGLFCSAPANCPQAIRFSPAPSRLHPKPRLWNTASTSSPITTAAVVTELISRAARLGSLAQSGLASRL